MTIKDFFRLIIKVLALYFLVITAFSGLPDLIIYGMHGNWKSLLWIGVALGLLSAILFYPDSIIEILKLDKGFDSNQISFGSLNDRILIKVACLLIGGFLVVGSISSLLLELYLAFKRDFFGQGEYMLPLIGRVINIGIGYLLLTNYDRVATFLLARKGE